MIRSDWHIHSEYSYDADNPLALIAERAKAQGLRAVGITDHANFNDPSLSAI
jgi:predicted metal-dependent phosphoesterase TrpH